MTDQYQWWRIALETGKGVETEKGSPRAGYYRVRNEAIAFWYRSDGGPCVCWRSNSQFPTPQHPDSVDELFGFCAPHPVSYEDYQFFRKEGRWPDQVAPVLEPLVELTPAEAIQREIGEQRAAVIKWRETEPTITTQGQADKAANYAAEFARLEKMADDLRDGQKRPHLEAGRKVDAEWKPIIERAADLKKWAKKLIEPFLLAEKERIAAEDKARREEAAKLGPAAPLAPPPERAKAGTSGRSAHLRTHIVHEIVDMPALMAYIATKNDLPAEFLRALQTLVNDWRRMAHVVPGVESKAQDGVA